MQSSTAQVALESSSSDAPAARRGLTAASWVAQVVAAVIMGQTLFFKFSGAPEAVALFETLGVEPWGRLATGGIELVAVVLLLVPRTAALGGLLTVGPRQDPGHQQLTGLLLDRHRRESRGRVTAPLRGQSPGQQRHHARHGPQPAAGEERRATTAA